MTVTYTPEALQKIAWSAYPEVLNKKNAIKADLKNMPWKAFLEKVSTDAPIGGVTATGVNGLTVKYQTQSDLDIQGFERRDALAFNEQQIELETLFPWSNVHMGLTYVHDDMEAACGVTIIPNAARSKSLGKGDGSSLGKLVDYWMATLEAQDDAFDVKMDQTLLTDNSANAKLPQGLDAYMSIPAASGRVTTGSIGSKLRSSSDVLQHYAEVGLTYGAGGTLRAGLTRARRAANLNTRGLAKGGSGVDFIMAGAGAIDRYTAYAEANNINYNTNLADKKRMADIGLPDSGISFEGIPIVHNPTFEILDTLLAPASPWTRRMYGLNSKAWRMAYAPGKKKLISFPADPHNQRITNVSLDSKCVLIPEIINCNFVATLAS